jgi:hypothetical protein
MPPELPTPQEEKAISAMIEADIDHAIEQKHLHEIVKDDEETIDE